MFREPRRPFASFSSVRGKVDGLLRQLQRVLHDARLDAQLGKLSVRIYAEGKEYIDIELAMQKCGKRQIFAYWVKV
jgi:hypothetical protein